MKNVAQREHFHEDLKVKSRSSLSFHYYIFIIVGTYWLQFVIIWLAKTLNYFLLQISIKLFGIDVKLSEEESEKKKTPVKSIWYSHWVSYIQHALESSVAQFSF